MNYEDLVRRVAATSGFAVEETLSVGNRQAATSERQVFRLRLCDGSALKARVLESESVAERVATLTRRLPAQWSARCIAQKDRVILSEWVEGCTPSDPRECVETMREIARLQARLHSLPAPAETSVHDCTTLVKWQRLYSEWLARLSARGQLTHDQCEVLLGAAATPPASGGIVVSHGDLFRENLIRARSGALVLIDHETLNLAPVEYDLARTLYLNAFRAEESRRYLRYYGEASEGTQYVAGALEWWAPFVWSQSAQFRLAMEQPGWERPLRLLEARAARGQVEA